MNEQLAAYHNDHAVKAKYVNRLKDHMDADELIRKFGWDGASQRGCAIGCTFNAYDHTRFPTELGMPVWLAHLCDFLHEKTSEDVWPTLQLRILEAIPLGFSNWHAVLRDMMLKCLEIARPHADDRGQTAIDHAAACWRGERDDWQLVYASTAGQAVAREAAWTARTAEPYATYAAADTARAAASAVWTAAYADARGTRTDANNAGEWAADRIAEELLESIKRHSK